MKEATRSWLHNIFNSFPTSDVHVPVPMSDQMDTAEKEKTILEVEERSSRKNSAGAQEASSEEEWATIDRKINLKLDLLIIPLVTTVYLLAFLDRANIGNARVVSACNISTPWKHPMTNGQAGLQADLGLSDYQYQIGRVQFSQIDASS